MTMKRAGKREWPSRVLVLHLITWEGGASFLDQSRTIMKQKYPFWLVWNRRKQVVCFIWQENQSNVLQVCPFPCGCVGELWIMLIHLMDHLSTKTDLEVWVTSSVDNHCWSHIVVGRLLFNMVAEKFRLKLLAQIFLAHLCFFSHSGQRFLPSCQRFFIPRSLSPTVRTLPCSPGPSPVVGISRFW